MKDIADSIPQALKKDPRIVCPVCKKLFMAYPEHVYHDKKNRKVCSWTCARKSGGM